MLGAPFAASLQKSGMLKELPKEMNADAVKFILRYEEEELRQLQGEMKGLQK